MEWYNISELEKIDLSDTYYCVCRIEYLKSNKTTRKGDWDLVTLLYIRPSEGMTAGFFNIPKNTKVTHFLPIPNFPTNIL